MVATVDVTDSANQSPALAPRRPEDTSKCMVPGCGSKLSLSRRRSQLCDFHWNAESVDIGSARLRYCQKCHRLQPLEDFSEGARTCAAKVAQLNTRRRAKAARPAAEEDRPREGGRSSQPHEASPARSSSSQASPHSSQQGTTHAEVTSASAMVSVEAAADTIQRQFEPRAGDWGFWVFMLSETAGTEPLDVKLPQCQPADLPAELGSALQRLYPPGPFLRSLALAQRRLSLARLPGHRPALGWTPHMWALCQNRASPCKRHCSLPCVAQPLPSQAGAP